MRSYLLLSCITGCTMCIENRSERDIRFILLLRTLKTNSHWSISHTRLYSNLSDPTAASCYFAALKSAISSPSLQQFSKRIFSDHGFVYSHTIITHMRMLFESSLGELPPQPGIWTPLDLRAAIKLIAARSE